MSPASTVSHRHCDTRTRIRFTFHIDGQLHFRVFGVYPFRRCLILRLSRSVSRKMEKLKLSHLSSLRPSLPFLYRFSFSLAFPTLVLFVFDSYFQRFYEDLPVHFSYTFPYFTRVKYCLWLFVFYLSSKERPFFNLFYFFAKFSLSVSESSLYLS